MKAAVQQIGNLFGPLCEDSLSNVGRSISVTENYGGEEGSAWDDKVCLTKPTVIGIRKIDISYGSQINSIQVTYLLADGTLYMAPRHGGSGNFSSSILLAEGERIVRVEGTTNGSAISHLAFTSKNPSAIENTYGPYGEIGHIGFNLEGYILGFRGHASTILQGLRVYYLPPLIRSNETFGGSCVNKYYDDNLDAIIPPVVGIKNITIHHGDLVDGIQATYILLGGGLYEGSNIGGRGGGSTTVTLNDNEEIYQMNATSFDLYLGQLTIHSRLQGTLKTHGPYGIDVETSHEVSGVILGFYGYASFHPGVSGDVVCSIGIYTVK